MKKGNKEKESELPGLIETVKFLSVLGFVEAMKVLTKYPPFSSFWQGRAFHYKNRDYVQSYEKILTIFKEEELIFQKDFCTRDRYFIVLAGKFKNMKQPKIEEKLENIKQKLLEQDMYFQMNSGQASVLIKNNSWIQNNHLYL